MVDPLSYHSLHNWRNKGCGMCYPFYGMVHIKEPLLLIRKSSPCSGASEVFSLAVGSGAMSRWIDPSWDGPIELV